MKRPFGVMVAVGLAVFLAAPAWADTGPPTQSSGNGIFVTLVSSSSRTADGNTFLDLSFTGSFSGTFTGTFTETVTEAIHPDGSVTVAGFGTFTGHAGACGTGSYNFQVEGQGTPASVMGSFRSIDEAAANITIHTVNTFIASGLTFKYAGIYTC